jgi:hypothetical protein
VTWLGIGRRQLDGDPVRLRGQAAAAPRSERRRHRRDQHEQRQPSRQGPAPHDPPDDAPRRRGDAEGGDAEGVTYSNDFTQRSYTTGLPVFPSIGIEYIP